MSKRAYIGIKSQKFTLKNLVPAMDSLSFEVRSSSGSCEMSTAHTKYGSKALCNTGVSGYNEMYSMTTTKFKLIPSHFYYACVEVYQETKLGSIDFFWPSGSPSMFGGKAPGDPGTWTKCTNVTNRSTFTEGEYPIRLDFNNGGTVGKIWYDGLMLIDLTEAFGAGNEPGSAWCQENIPYFTGTTTVERAISSAVARKIKGGYIGIPAVSNMVGNGHFNTFDGWVANKTDMQYSVEDKTLTITGNPTEVRYTWANTAKKIPLKSGHKYYCAVDCLKSGGGMTAWAMYNTTTSASYWAKAIEKPTDNLLRYPTTFEGWTLASNITAQDGVINWSAVSTLGWNAITNRDTPVKYSDIRDKEITVSFEVKCDQYAKLNNEPNNGLIVNLALFKPGAGSRHAYMDANYFNHTLSDKWERIVYTFTANDSYFSMGGDIDPETDNFVIGLYNYSLYSMQIRNVKVEKADKSDVRQTHYYTATANAETDFLLYGITYEWASDFVVKWDNLMVIDLTELYGAGKEPTQEQCDAFFSMVGEEIHSADPSAKSVARKIVKAYIGDANGKARKFFSSNPVISLSGHGGINGYYAWIEVGGTKHYEVKTLEVTAGTVIKCCVEDYYYGTDAYIKLNGNTVVQATKQDTYSYEYTVTKDVYIFLDYYRYQTMGHYGMIEIAEV